MVTSTLRPATPADATALTALRVAMFTSMGQHEFPAGFAAASDALFARRLASPEFRAVLVETPDGVVAGGVAWLTEILADPNNLSGRRAHVANVCTLPGHRGQGHARAVMTDLLAWCDSHGITKVELTATPAGRPLYVSLGFVPAAGEALRLLSPPSP